MLINTVGVVWVALVIGTNSLTNGFDLFGAATSENEKAIVKGDGLPSEGTAVEPLQIVRAALEAIFDREGSGESSEDVPAVPPNGGESSEEVPAVPPNGGESSEEVRAVPPNGGESREVVVQPVPQIGGKSPEVVEQAVPKVFSSRNKLTRFISFLK